ncbi:hypothetical protein AAII07_28830 [Microvirga sp. 0TCS3.31]
MTDLGTEIADLIRSINFNDPQQGYEDFCEVVELMNPPAKPNDIIRAQKILENDYRAELAGREASFSTVRRMLALVRMAIPDGIRYGQAIAQKDAADDSGMAFYLIELVDWYNPTPVIWMVLFSSAVELHLKWEPAGLGWYVCSDPDGPHGTPQSLVESFPSVALRAMRLVEDTVRRGRRYA